MFLHDLSAASSPISTFSFFSPSLHTSSKTQPDWENSTLELPLSPSLISRFERTSGKPWVVEAKRRRILEGCVYSRVGRRTRGNVGFEGHTEGRWERWSKLKGNALYSERARDERTVSGFLRFSSARVSWIWRIRLVCSPPRGPAATADRCCCREAEPSGMKPTRRELPGRDDVRAKNRNETTASAQANHRPTDQPTETGEHEPNREPQELRTDLLFVTRVCVNPSAVSSPSVRTSVCKRAATKATMYYHRWQSIFVLLSPLSHPFVTFSFPISRYPCRGSLVSRTFAPGKWANKGGTGGRLDSPPYSRFRNAALRKRLYTYTSYAARSGRVERTWPDGGDAMFRVRELFCRSTGLG